MKQLLIFFTLCSLALPAWAQSPSAMITSLNGSALVLSGDQKIVAEPMMNLTPRTMIELREGASMSVVFFSRGSHERFTGPALIGIGKNRSKVFKGNASCRTEVTSGSALISSIDPNALTESLASGGVNVSVAGATIGIAWSTPQPGPYLVSVFKPGQNGQPRTSVWAEELASKNVTYTGPSLDPKTTYVAEVKVGSTVVDASLFRVAGGQVDMLGAAKAEAAQMATANPADTTPHVLMHTLYQQVGNNDSAVLSLHPALDGEGEEDAFVNRMNVMGAQVNRKANQDTAGAQAFYAAEDNWTFAPFWDPNRWAWDGWDDF